MWGGGYRLNLPLNWFALSKSISLSLFMAAHYFVLGTKKDKKKNKVSEIFNFKVRIVHREHRETSNPVEQDHREEGAVLHRPPFELSVSIIDFRSEFHRL